ncbi:hypothetical protein BpHYR1_009236 [Brachionus plicatilis]|uniref:Uncharacterized protein n=1 Tax=Brachionus plicatilis TaxID=10195 RepID=A0A3M7PYW3_BRAPC|nr:hypothetical protein BpHYR1_009236 [Brachionus plicatilis]
MYLFLQLAEKQFKRKYKIKKEMDNPIRQMETLKKLTLRYVDIKSFVEFFSIMCSYIKLNFENFSSSFFEDDRFAI